MKEFKITFIEPEDLKQRIVQNDTTFAIIDVRDYDYGSGHIKTPTPQQYHHIPIGELVDSDHQRGKQLLADLNLQQLEKGKSMDLIFHCFYSQQRGPYGAQHMISLLEELYNNSSSAEEDEKNVCRKTLVDKVNVKVLRGGWGLWRTRFYLERDTLIVPLPSDSSSSSDSDDESDSDSDE